jgi:hypothetical protein
MRKIIFILAFIPLFASAQVAHPIKKVLDMEYWKGVLDANNKLWAFGITLQNSTSSPLPGGRTIIDAGTAFNSFLVVANDGTVWQSGFYNGSGLSSWTQVVTDSSGTTISDATAIWGFESTYWIKRAGGAIWQGGNDYFQILGTSGATLRPFKISPGSVSIGILRANGNGGSGEKTPLVGVSSDSLTVYEWTTGSGASPATLTATGLGTGKFITACTDGNNPFGYVNYFLIQQTFGSPYGHPYAIGNNSILMGAPNSGTSYNYTTLHDMYSQLGLTSLVKEITVSPYVAELIDSAHNMWELGGYNMQGQLGIGQETVNKYTYSTFPTYSWTFTTNEDPVYGIQQIGIGNNWSHLNNQGFFVFYSDALNVTDSLYSWGRGKQNILGQSYQMDANDYANHPNGYDLLVPTLSNSKWIINNPPFAAWTAPTWSAGSNQTIGATFTTLTASGSPPLITLSSSPFTVLNYTVSTTAWTQTSGPNTANIVSPTSLSTVVSGMIPGTYVFQNVETDNNTGTNAASVTIIVTSTGGPPTVTASASPATITLPTSSTNLSGTVTYNGGSSGVSCTWANTVKPGGAAAPTITPGGTLTAPTAAISGLTTPGLYTFSLTAQDSNSNTTVVYVNVNVIAASTGCSCIVTPF